jgi:Replication-relaxation
MNHNLNRRYVLTELGMRSLAARAGVPPDTYSRHGGVTFLDSTQSDDPARVIRHREHTIGVNRFFAQLAADARHAGWRLDEWRNEAESTRRFVDLDGRMSWIRPDGSGVLVRGAESRSFLLEYDRGTLDVGDYRAKFEGYLRYFARGAWEGDFPSEPVLLFVCSDDRAEERVALALRTLAPTLPVLMTTEWRYLPRGADRSGTLGSAWGRGSRERGRVPLSPDERDPASEEVGGDG